MFSRFVALLSVAALVAVSTAAPNAVEARNDGDSPTTICCNQKLNSDSTAYFQNPVDGLLGVLLGGINLPAGLTCDPITIIGVGSGAQCTVQQVNCQNDNFNGAVVIGCTPINVNL